MFSREFRPTLFDPDDGLWKAVSISAFIGGGALMGWLALSQPESRHHAYRAQVIAMSERAERQIQLAGPSVEHPEDPGVALKRQLRKQARRGKVRPELLLETFMQQEEAHGGGDSQLLMDEFIRRSTFDASSVHPVEQLAELKAHMVSDPDLVYVSNAYSFTEVLLDDRLQCQSTTMTIVLAWLQQEVTQAAGGPRPVLVLSMNHVQPGLLYEGALHVMEGTSRGDRVAKLHLAELEDVRVLDAADALVWTLLQEDTPQWIKDRMLIFNNREGFLKFNRGSGSNSWLHIPYGFGKRIVLTSTAHPLSKNTDPAKMLLP